MKTKLPISLIILFCIIFIQHNSYCQGYLFTVIASTNNVSKKSNSGKEWTKISTGDKLYSGDKIKVNKNSYLGLAYSSGETVEIKKEGTYNVNDIKKNLSLKNSSLLKKLSDYVANEIVNVNDQTVADDHGAVFRVRTNYLDVDFPRSTSLFDTTIQFKWYSYSGGKNYIFKLINSSQVTLFMQKLTDTVITLNLKNLDLEKDTSYYWYLYLPNNEKVCSDTNSIKIVPRKIADEILNEINEIEKSNSQNNLILNNVLLAKYCEEKQLNREALKYYEKAFKEAKNVGELKDLYKQFLFRNNLFKRIYAIQTN